MQRSRNLGIFFSRSLYSEWASRFTDWTSVHGLVWYNRTDNKCARLCVMITAAIVVFGLPTFLILSVVRWALDLNIVSEGETIQKVQKCRKICGIGCVNCVCV